MEAIECIKTRRSIRKFTNDALSHQDIEKIIEAASYAPSWKNTQIVRYTIIENRDIIDAIAKDGVLGFSFNAKTISRCPCLAVQSVVTGLSGREADGSFSTEKNDSWEMYDAGISAEAFCLAAHTLDIATVIMGIVDGEKISELISLPENQKVTTLIAMGHPAVNNSAPQRLEVSELVSYVK